MLVTTLIPCQRNDGSPVSAAELAELLGIVRDCFGRLTVEGRAIGHWIDERDGRSYEDESVRVTVALPHERLAEIETVVRDIGRRLGQKTMYFEVRFFDGVRMLPVDEPARPG